MKTEDFIKERALLAEQAAQAARERASVARWNLDVVVFLFAILITIVILLFEGFESYIVAPIGVFGLTMVWIVGQRRGNQLYKLFYREEMVKLEQREHDILFAKTETTTPTTPATPEAEGKGEQNSISS